jgi:hypothetical protein
MKTWVMIAGVPAEFRTGQFLMSRRVLLRDQCIRCCHMIVSIDGFWTDDRIYWTLWHSAWLHFTVHYYIYKCPQSRLHCGCLVATSNDGHSPSFEFPNCPQPHYCQLVLLVTSRHGPRRCLFHYCCNILPLKHACLRSRYVAMTIV